MRIQKDSPKLLVISDFGSSSSLQQLSLARWRFEVLPRSDDVPGMVGPGPMALTRICGCQVRLGSRARQRPQAHLGDGVAHEFAGVSFRTRMVDHVDDQVQSACGSPCASVYGRLQALCRSHGLRSERKGARRLLSRCRSQLLRVAEARISVILKDRRVIDQTSDRPAQSLAPRSGSRAVCLRLIQTDRPVAPPALRPSFLNTFCNRLSRGLFRGRIVYGDIIPAALPDKVPWLGPRRMPAPVTSARDMDYLFPIRSHQQ